MFFQVWEELSIELQLADAPANVGDPAPKIRSGMETKLVLTTDQGAVVSVDPKLIALLDEASRLLDTVLVAPDRSLADIARSTGQCRKRLTRLLRVAWLAPDIVQRIVEGRRPAALTASALLAADLPPSWAEQRTQLAIA